MCIAHKNGEDSLSSKVPGHENGDLNFFYRDRVLINEREIVYRKSRSTVAR